MLAEKTRAPGEILLFQLFVETVYFPSKARRAGLLAIFCNIKPRKSPSRVVARWDFISVVLSHNERNPF